MYGAIFGDIVGSVYEFDKGEKTKLFRLFTEDSTFTDDTVMTLAVAQALLEVGPAAEPDAISQAVAAWMRRLGQRYPNAGYGGKFAAWLSDPAATAYGSYGNGSAMRVSPAGWFYETIERTREVARATAAPTHNHPEGIKGAEAVASVIFLARNGWSRPMIRGYITREFGYDLKRTLDEIRPGYKMDATCQGSVPEAIIAFLEAEDFEDAVRGAVSIGGDTDTTACMAGAMAEAYFGIPE
ncbi:MAG: ADP-ribosylglycohydrolase family protein, partial [Lachnospiraceae bacterium]|nr:ADP-ribosylglycohydrolase family protein [Lachnospiraceae bacterium]